MKGIVSFGNIPLGVDYKLEEIKQPNKYYDGDLSVYNRTITDFNGDNPKLSATVNSDGLASTVINYPNYRNVSVQKNNVDGQALRGAGFVLIQVDKGKALNITSVAQAKQMAMYQDEQGHIVSGDNQGKPYIAKIGMNDTDKDVAQFLMVKSNPDLYDYYVVEVEAPNGYGISVEPVKVNFKNTDPIDLTTTMTDDFKPAIPTTGSDNLLIVGIVVLTLIGGMIFLVKWQHRIIK